VTPAPVASDISKNSRLVHCDSAMVAPSSVASGHAVDHRACANTVAFPVTFLTPVLLSLKVL
jgi:hypothetical protein